MRGGQVHGGIEERAQKQGRPEGGIQFGRLQVRKLNDRRPHPQFGGQTDQAGGHAGEGHDPVVFRTQSAGEEQAGEGAENLSQHAGGAHIDHGTGDTFRDLGRVAQCLLDSREDWKDSHRRPPAEARRSVQQARISHDNMTRRGRHAESAAARLVIPDEVREVRGGRR